MRCKSANSWLPRAGRVGVLQRWPATAGLQRAVRSHVVIHAAGERPDCEQGAVDVRAFGF